MEPGLERKVADLLRHRETAQASLDAARRVERALKHAEVDVAAASCLQQAILLCERDALLDPADRLMELALPGERNSESIVRLHLCRRGLAHPLGVG
jgi:hypothetical protein